MGLKSFPLLGDNKKTKLKGLIMKTLTIIGGEYAGLWNISINDLTKGFLFVKSIPFAELSDIRKTESIKKEIFAEITLSNGTCLRAKMHVDAYSKLYSRYLEWRNQTQNLTLPQSRISLSALPATIAIFVIFISILLDDRGANSKTGTSTPSPTTNLATPAPTVPNQVAIPELFQKPYKYISMPVSRASETFGVKENEGGNLVVETPSHHILFEGTNGLISYVNVEFNGTAPCSQNAGFESGPLLRALGIEPSSLELANKQAHYHRYYDHTNRLKISVACHSDGGNLEVGFSSKYYLQ